MNLKDNNQMSNEVNSNPNDISRIAKGTNIIKGEIETSADMRFDGNFTGKIVSKGRVIIGETALLGGEIICANLDIWGNFKEGVCYVQDTLSLKKSGNFTGEIHTGKFAVELGSKFDGTVKMISDEEFQKFAKVPQVPQAPQAPQQPSGK